MTTSFHHSQAPSQALQTEELLRMLRWMLLARRLDEAELRLLRQQKVCFSISGAGHEAVQAAAALLLRPGEDWFFPYYRDRTLCLGLGVTPRAMLLQAMGRASDPSSGGRQMPSHWGDEKLHIVNQSSPTGTQFPQAVGASEAGRIAARLPLRDDRPLWKSDELVYVSGGEGSASEGEFFEAISAAVLRKLPVLFLIQDNQYAISVPAEDQTPAGNISTMLAEFPGLAVFETDGLDPLASYDDLAGAVQHIRSGAGPALVHAHVVRLFSHSNSDEQRDYRDESELSRDRRRDPIVRFRDHLIKEGALSQSGWESLQESVDRELATAIEEAAREPEPDPATATRHLFAPASDLGVAEVGRADLLPVNAGAGKSGGDMTLVKAVRFALETEMARDPRIVVFGQDVADVAPSRAASGVPGKGGVFKATHGLQERFGSHRVFNAPIAEAAIVGRAIGMAIRGLRPVVEIQFFDYIWPAMMQLRNELGLLRWRSDGHFSAPVVVRVPIGGYVRGGAVYHSQTGEAIFCHCPGLRVVMPSNAHDAAGLLRAAIRSGDPVLFLEHKHLYRQAHTRRVLPRVDFTVPLGSASVAREGDDLTVVTYGALVHRSLEVAERLADEGLSVEVIDLRSLQPYDFATIAESVAKTSRVLVAAEECSSFGVAAELAARIGEELFLDLDAPVRRLGALETPVGYSPVLERAILPQTEDIERAVRELASF